MDNKRLTEAQKNGEAPMPHPLTPEANREPHPGEITYPEQQEQLGHSVKQTDETPVKKGKKDE